MAPLSRTLTALSFVASSLTLVAADSVETSNSTSWYSSVAPVQSFHSAPKLSPPEVNILTHDAARTSEGYTLLSYRGSAVSQPAPLLMDNNGSLVWSGAEAGYGDTMDLVVQQYKGEDVLTFFTGSFYSGGYGYGTWNILSSNYSLIRTVSSLNQTEDESDFHEFILTDNNTALVESWRVTQTDLTGASGTTDGWTWDCVFQEIALGDSREQDELLFEWSSLEGGVSPSETYFEVSGNGNSSENPFDYCHINSAAKVGADGNYLVSMRGPSTIYYISASTGEIIWRLGGKNSNFTMGTNATFWYQHDARIAPGSSIDSTTFNMTLFDNAAGGGEPAEATGRAIMLELDTEAWTATLVREDLPSFHEPVASQGSYQALDDGAYFVGWGAQPFYSEYAADGTLVQDVTFGTTESIVMSYRAFKQSWAGYPLSSPSLAVNGSSAFASWNGATAVSSWVLVGGTSEDAATTRLAEEARNGFETEIGGLDDKYTFLAVAAMGSDGTCLGVSPVYSTSSMASTSTNGTCPSGSTVAAAGTNGTASASGSDNSSGAVGGRAIRLVGAAVAAFAAVIMA
ncbi:ASST-domain-containing protein [Rhodotorula diobovata]|uniref:ASST-domain-containing protein n=1 Tax=Rhodotorula diobovata TaxID=5288 RepID=A0A5C5FN34_9BASI|nr:ASST-domain-containing protein [Rhodotorula diobovata]